MAASYAPLVLPTKLHPMPQYYQTKIPQFDATGAINSKQHIDKMNDLFDLQEVEESDINMRLFAQSLGGEVRKRFKNLAVASIDDFAAFH